MLKTCHQILLQFKKLIQSSQLASQYLQNELTIFAPSDTAMAKYTGEKDDTFILNHMGKCILPIYRALL